MSGAGDDNFKPRLGRIRSETGSHQPSMKAFLKSARKGGKKSSAKSGRRISFSGTRRVYIQARVQRLSSGGGGAQKAHVSYLERDGAGQDRERAEFYNENTEGLDGQDWLKDHSGDRHHFRFIVSPEDGEKLRDLKPFVRDLVSQMEIDLETKLDWVAVDHFNTEHPHTHIVMSGRRGDGKDLVISRDYLSHGMRERGSALLTRQLGLQSEAERSAKLARETGNRKITRMDRMMMREQHRNSVIDLARLKQTREHYQARLRALRDLGLAEHQSGTRCWPSINRVPVGQSMKPLDPSSLRSKDLTPSPSV